MAVVNGGDPNYLLSALELQNPWKMKALSLKNMGYKPLKMKEGRGFPWWFTIL